MSLKESLDTLHEHGVSLASRTIVLDGEVDDKMTGVLIRGLEVLKQRNSNPIKLIINSEGGEVLQALAIYNLIQACAMHVTITVVGECSSSACIILQAADLRQSYPDALIMYHQGVSSSASIATNEVDAFNAYEKKLDDRANAIVYARMNAFKKITRAKFNKILTAGMYYTAAEAVEKGLVDEVL